MKHLKLFESFEDIDSICEKYNIDNYTINSDGSIDVDGDVVLSKKGLTKLPLKFNRVSGEITSEDHVLDISNHLPGLYLFRFKNGDSIFTKKILKE